MFVVLVHDCRQSMHAADKVGRLSGLFLFFSSELKVNSALLYINTALQPISGVAPGHHLAALTFPLR